MPINLTDEQQHILNNCEKNIYISAAPGSGKSTMLSHIADKLLKNHQNYVLLVTFTNKAAKSIISKCEKVDQSRIMGGTFHGLANSFIRKNGIDWHICDEGKKRLIIKKVFDCKKDKDKFNEIYELINQEKSQWPYVPSEQTALYNLELGKYNLVDFDDMIYNFIHNCSILSFPNITHILCDELQDTSGPQLEMLKQLQSKLKCNMIGVADDDQCYKFGSKVKIIRKHKHEIINVEDILIGDKVESHRDFGTEYIQVTNKSISKKQTLNISTHSNNLSTSYEHKWFIIKPKSNKPLCYLMWKKDVGFRIGTSTFATIEQRMNSEKSHKVWILEECDNRDEAEVLEKILSLRFQVPIQTFIQHNKTDINYKKVFNLYGKNGYNVLKEYNLNFDYPFLNASSSRRDGVINITLTMNGKQGSNYIKFESYELLKYKLNSINLNKNKDTAVGRILIKNFKEASIKIKELSEELTALGFQVNVVQKLKYFGKIFSVVTANQVKTGSIILTNKNTELFNEEEVTSIKKESESNVIDIEVAETGRIVVNNILTHNCIYAWRGARPENVLDFINVFGCTTLNMGYNFRSAKRIVESSSKLIENNKSRIKKVIRPFKDELGQVISYQTQSVFTEIDYVITKCRQYKDKEIAILYRNRTYKNHLEFELKKAKLEYCINDSLDICDRSAIKVMLSCMRIAAMIGDIYDLEIASKGIKGIGKTTVDKLRKEITADNNLSSILRAKFQDPKQARRFKSIIDMTNWFTLHKDSSLDLLARHMETLFIPSFDYQPDMKTFILDITKCYKINITDIRDLCNDLGLDGKEEHNDENATIELSTVHGYKGLEKDIVIMPWSQMYLDDSAWKEINVEDERRLFYVGATRAKEKLFMSYCGNKPRFIKEMGI